MLLMRATFCTHMQGVASNVQYKYGQTNQLNLFVSHSASGMSMTGVCNVGEADEISACVWRIHGKEADGKQEDHKPQYHIEF